MTPGNKQLLFAIGSMVGINILINLLPSPFGLIAMGGFMLYFIYQVYNQTRY